jgi:hypothetical protein
VKTRFFALFSLVVENCRIGTTIEPFLRIGSPRTRAVGLMIISKIGGGVDAAELK